MLSAVQCAVLSLATLSFPGPEAELTLRGVVEANAGVAAEVHSIQTNRRGRQVTMATTLSGDDGMRLALKTLNGESVPVLRTVRTRGETPGPRHELIVAEATGQLLVIEITKN